MIILRAVLLGMLQSLTEFFPFSNTAHIILLQRLFDYHKTYMAYDIVIDAGTVIAIMIFYAHDFVQMLKESPALLVFPFSKNKNSFFWERPYALTLSLILVSCITTAISRFIFIEAGDVVGRIPWGMGVIWIVMGVIIYMTRDMRPGSRGAYEMNHQDAFLIGLAQGLTVFPGISRLGITLFVALYLGIERKEAVRYSLLLAIPYIVSASIVKFAGGAQFYQSDQMALLVSFVTAIFSGVAVLAASVYIIGKGKFFRFSYYCFLIGAFAFFYSFFPGAGF